MTNLRKSFILLSAAITMGSLQQAQAGKAKKTPPSETKQDTAGVKQGKTQQRVDKQPKASKRSADRDVFLGMPAGTLYDVVTRSELA